MQRNEQPALSPAIARVRRRVFVSTGVAAVGIGVAVLVPGSFVIEGVLLVAWAGYLAWSVRKMMSMYAAEQAAARAEPAQLAQPSSAQREARTSPGALGVALAGALIVAGGVALFSEGHEFYAQGAVALFVILVGAGACGHIAARRDLRPAASPTRGAQAASTPGPPLHSATRSRRRRGAGASVGP